MQSRSKGVLKDFDRATCVDKRDVEPGRGELPLRLMPQKLGCGAGDPRHLPYIKPFGRLSMGRTALHLYEDDRRTVTRDQVDLTPLAAPATGGDVQPRPPLVARDRLFGRDPGMVRCHPARLAHHSSINFNARW